MTEINFDFMADPTDAVAAAKLISESIADIQAQAAKMSTTPLNITPQLVPLSTVLQTANIAMRALGVQSAGLSLALRAVMISSKLAALSTIGFSGAVSMAAKSVQAFFVSIGPVGWVLLAVTAAAMAAVKAFNYFKKEAEDAAAASAAFAEAEKARITNVQELEIALMEAQGKTYEASKARIIKSAADRDAARNKEMAEQQGHLDEMNLSAEEYERQRAELFKKSADTAITSNELKNAQLKKLDEDRAKDAEEAADREASARRQAVVAIKNAVEEELTYLGLESGALIERRMLAAGANEEDAKRTGALKDQVDLLKETARIEADHTKTVEDLNFEIKMNTAILEGNVEAQKELNIQKLISSGKTRAQAEEEILLGAIVKDQEAAIKAKDDAAKEAIKEQEKQAKATEKLTEVTEKNNAASFVSIDQLYKNLQLAASKPSEGLLGDSIRSSSGSKPSESSTGRGKETKVVEILSKIYEAVDAIKRRAANIGGLS